MYQPRNESDCCMISVRGLRYTFAWGSRKRPPIDLSAWRLGMLADLSVHGGLFSGGSRVAAPDWRGHGKSANAPQGYGFPVMSPISTLCSTGCFPALQSRLRVIASVAMWRAFTPGYGLSA